MMTRPRDCFWYTHIVNTEAADTTRNGPYQERQARLRNTNRAEKVDIHDELIVFVPVPINTGPGIDAGLHSIQVEASCPTHAPKPRREATHVVDDGPQAMTSIANRRTHCVNVSLLGDIQLHNRRTVAVWQFRAQIRNTTVRQTARVHVKPCFIQANSHRMPESRVTSGD